ncbi:MAG: DMT family transporter [bacterium]|jgi:drug/metabolite transporter (DMT)-like permease|nr:DMT family transporter [candidate division KSB1 bacterium]MDH7560921.1 DMT family transporter [bacterium]
MPSSSQQRARLIWALVLVGLLAVSLASILIKLCAAPPLAIAAYRLTIAAFVFVAATLVKGWSPLRPFSPPQLRIAIASGAFLCLHFATWITSLRYTSVASSVVLVQTAPIFVALGSRLLLRESVPPLLWLGIGLAMLGGIIIAGQDWGLGVDTLRGDLLALAGAVGAAGYWLAGRRLRATIGILHYAAVVYSTAAILLTALALLSGARLWPYPTSTLLLLLLIGLVPQVIGHTSFNYGLRFLPASVVSVLVLGEPVGATVLAYFILAETVSATKALGGMVILAGVYLTARAGTARAAPGSGTGESG